MEDCGCSRRGVLRSLFAGSIMLPGVISQLLADESGAGGVDADPLAPRAPHFAGKAKRVIFLFMSGGVSHLDSFDPKARLIAEDGKPVSDRAGAPSYLRPNWAFRPGGTCGTEVSDLFPHVRQCMDDICLIRSMKGDHSDHFQATLGIHTGSVSVARPSMGSWISYGLGTMNQNLPSFVALAPQLTYAGTQVWSSDFLPACHQGTRVLAGAEPIPDLNRRAPSEKVQEMELGLLERFNRMHQQQRPAEPVLAARIKAFETAFGMQQSMPDVLDLSKESDATLALYGLERDASLIPPNQSGKQGGSFAWQCLIARRMAERGVRFIELIDVGSSNNWDAHVNIKSHELLAKNVDKPISGLLRDLKSRGMLDDTLVVWTTEFGRTPQQDGPMGRSHHNKVYSSWLAGGGVKGGIVYGKSDEYGREVADDPVHVHDFHATILHLLGFDHTRLTFRHAGRDFRLTDVHGQVVKEILV